MLRIAKGWWTSDGSDDVFGEVEDILHGKPAKVPDLLRALVDAAPEGQLHRIGTGPIETLEMGIELGWRKEPATMELLLAAKLTASEMFEVLRGAYPSYIVEMDVALARRNSDEGAARVASERGCAGPSRLALDRSFTRSSHATR